MESNTNRIPLKQSVQRVIMIDVPVLCLRYQVVHSTAILNDTVQ